MQAMRNRLARPAWILLGTIMCVSVLGLVALGLGPRLGHYRTLTVLSGSMEPEIPTGSVVVVTPKPLREVRVGDVIVFNAPTDGRPVTHRVIEVLEDGNRPLIRTKGDANASADPWNARLLDEPAWEVRTAVPGIGHAVLWLRQPVVRQAAVLGAPVLLAVIWLVQIWRRPREELEPAGEASRVDAAA